jgi:hypothetical protein
MDTKDKILGTIILLLVLYLLFKDRLTAKVTTRFLDPATKFPIVDTDSGRNSLVIGEAVLPVGIRNDKNDSAFQYAAVNGGITCPIGTEVVLDPLDNKAYCMVTS